MAYSDAFESYNQFRDASQDGDGKDRETGEVLLGFVDPLLMKGTESAVNSYLTKRANNLKFRAQEQARIGQAGEEAPDVYEPAVIPEGMIGATPQQQIMDFDPEEPTFLPPSTTAPQVAHVGEEAAEVGEEGAEAGEEAGAILGEGAELALDTSFMPEISAVVLGATLIASSAIAVVDLFKHEKRPPPPMANLPQIGL